jgi:hypothetical protein
MLQGGAHPLQRFSALQRAEIAEIDALRSFYSHRGAVSVLFNEPKLLKSGRLSIYQLPMLQVSVLFNEPKLLKFVGLCSFFGIASRFSALQRAEIAEIARSHR